MPLLLPDSPSSSAEQQQQTSASNALTFCIPIIQRVLLHTARTAGELLRHSLINSSFRETVVHFGDPIFHNNIAPPSPPRNSAINKQGQQPKAGCEQYKYTQPRRLANPRANVALHGFCRVGLAVMVHLLLEKTCATPGPLVNPRSVTTGLLGVDRLVAVSSSAKRQHRTNNNAKSRRYNNNNPISQQQHDHDGTDDDDFTGSYDDVDMDTYTEVSDGMTTTCFEVALRNNHDAVLDILLTRRLQMIQDHEKNLENKVRSNNDDDNDNNKKKKQDKKTAAAAASLDEFQRIINNALLQCAMTSSATKPMLKSAAVLLRFGATAGTFADKERPGALMFAVSRGFSQGADLVKLFLEKGAADPNDMSNAQSHSVLQAALLSPCQCQVVQALLNSPAVYRPDVKFQDKKSGGTAIHFAARSCPNCLRALLDYSSICTATEKPENDTAAERGKKPVMSGSCRSAIVGDNERSQSLLLAAAELMSSPDYNGETPLLAAAFQSKWECCKVLMEYFEKCVVDACYCYDSNTKNHNNTKNNNTGGAHNTTSDRITALMIGKFLQHRMPSSMPYSNRYLVEGVDVLFVAIEYSFAPFVTQLVETMSRWSRSSGANQQQQEEEAHRLRAWILGQSECGDMDQGQDGDKKRTLLDFFKPSSSPKDASAAVVVPGRYCFSHRRVARATCASGGPNFMTDRPSISDDDAQHQTASRPTVSVHLLNPMFETVDTTFFSPLASEESSLSSLMATAKTDDRSSGATPPPPPSGDVETRCFSALDFARAKKRVQIANLLERIVA